MKKLSLLACAAALVALPLSAQDAPKPEYPSPPEIVAKAKADEWVAIAASDLMVMELAPLNGKPRRVVIQLMPSPFSQGWIGNIRKLAAAQFWDGTSVNRVQDNYVVQWGDATEKKVLPEGLEMVPENLYFTDIPDPRKVAIKPAQPESALRFGADAYSRTNFFLHGWPLALDYISYVPIKDVVTGKDIPAPTTQPAWPVHCYGMVGVGRGLSPDTGSGAELYTVIGHAPRHLDRNIALVGRVIEGIEHLSSLPRGTGPLGFYEKEEERVPILSVRIGNDVTDLPSFEYLSTESASFAKYADARANRRDPFFNIPAGGADICNIPVPVRRKVN
jgi:cyclophilin family peptidyl-prolyl cis-trans isomerase